MRQTSNSLIERFGVLRFCAAWGIACTALAFGSMAHAQSEAECIAPQVQQLMNACAAKEYREADAALNTAWKSAKAFADAIGRNKALLEAQRAWLTYRDAACDVHASPFEGGSLQPLIQSTCLSKLTAERTRMLLEFNAY
ncbi:lysozyme inhibitor LprI family protein [uncultured Sulfitobacter sp.]|uniref:lysozyme inhibitor LprI family protein n=1 Tax=uncultured Sulfitobacter sp. TaxID=191468 RepID=UPI0026192BD3|nr:lysozyme inhibitor LprI family protein [uncultured Sulfitobacter sp.]